MTQPSPYEPQAQQPAAQQPGVQQPHTSSYGPKPGTELGADLGATLAFAGRSLLRAPAALLVAGLIYTVLITVIAVGAIVAGVGYLMSQSSQVGPAGEFPPGIMITYMLIVAGICLLMLPLMWFWFSGSARAGAEILERRKPTIGQALIGPGRVIGTSAVVTLLCAIGSALFYLPGIIAGFLLMFAVPASMRGAGVFAAIKESVSLVFANFATALVTWLVIGVIASIAGMLVLPFIALIPFGVLAQLGLYERLNGRELPDLESPEALQG